MMLSLRPVYALLTLVALLSLSACSTSTNLKLYDGNKKPNSELITVVVPSALDILEVDGKEYNDSPSLTEGSYQLQLLPGEHSFTAVYSETWGSEALGNIVQSDAFYFKTSAQAGSTFELKHNGPTELDSAEFDLSIDELKVWLLDTQTAKRIEPVAVVAYGNLLSRMAYRAVAPETTTVQAQPKEIAASKKQQAELTNVKSKAEDELQFWWKIADKKQRDGFQKWIVTLKEVKADNVTDEMQQKAADQLMFWWKLANVEQRESFLRWVGK